MGKKPKPKSKPKAKSKPKKTTHTFKKHPQLSTPKPTLGRPREWTDEDIDAEIVALEKWIADPKNFFINSFLNERKLHAEQAERFCKYSESFRDTYARARSVQEQRVVEGAMNRKFDSTFAKFLLQNKAGWKEKSEVSGDAANPLAVIMERISSNAKDPLDELFGED